jgi:hypothetical protein
MRKRTSKFWSVSSEDFKQVVINSKFYIDIAKYYNYSPNNSIYKMIKQRMKEEGLDIEEFEKKSNQAKIEQIRFMQKSNKIPLSQILVKNSTYNSSHTLKKRLIEEGLLKNECHKCGIGPEWNGEPLSLQLDHENGINDDNRIINLRLLCPNCHSQTPTFCGKHKAVVNKCVDCGKKIGKKYTRCVTCSNKSVEKTATTRIAERPNRLELIQLILTKPFRHIGVQFEVSDNAIRQWCRYENLPYRKHDIETKRVELENELDISKKNLFKQNGNFEYIHSFEINSTVKNEINCSKCKTQITEHSKSGLCSSCANKANSKVKNRPTREELIRLILDKPFLQIGADFGVSDNAISKWCKAENLPFRKKDIDMQREELLKEINTLQGA